MDFIFCSIVVNRHFHHTNFFVFKIIFDEWLIIVFMNIKEEQLNFTFPFWILVLFTTFFKCSKERIHKKRDRRWEKFHRSELPAHFTLFKEHMVRSHAKTKHEKKMYLEWMFFHLQCCFASAWNSEQLGFPLVVTFIFEYFSLFLQTSYPTLHATHRLLIICICACACVFCRACEKPRLNYVESM